MSSYHTQNTNKLLVSILAELQKISKKLDQSVFDPNAPSNAYGEGLVDGIQNAIARGLRGIER